MKKAHLTNMGHVIDLEEIAAIPESALEGYSIILKSGQILEILHSDYEYIKSLVLVGE